MGGLSDLTLLSSIGPAPGPRGGARAPTPFSQGLVFGRRQALLPSAELQTVPKTAHQLMQEQPEAVNAALDAFFLGLSEEDGDDGCLGPARRALSPR